MTMLQVPEGFPTRVWVEEELSGTLLPPGPWTLVGDAAVRPAWAAAGLPEPPGTLWQPLCEAAKRLETLLPWLEAWARIPLRRDATGGAGTRRAESKRCPAAKSAVDG